MGKNDHHQNVQELLDTMKRPNLKIHSVEEETEISNTRKDNALNEIIVEKFPNR